MCPLLLGQRESSGLEGAEPDHRTGSKEVEGRGSRPGMASWYLKSWDRGARPCVSFQVEPLRTSAASSRPPGSWQRAPGSTYSCEILPEPAGAPCSFRSWRVRVCDGTVSHRIRPWKVRAALRDVTQPRLCDLPRPKCLFCSSDCGNDSLLLPGHSHLRNVKGLLNNN